MLVTYFILFLAQLEMFLASAAFLPNLQRLEESAASAIQRAGVKLFGSTENNLARKRKRGWAQLPWTTRICVCVNGMPKSVCTSTCIYYLHLHVTEIMQSVKPVSSFKVLLCCWIFEFNALCLTSPQLLQKGTVGFKKPYLDNAVHYPWCNCKVCQ